MYICTYQYSIIYNINTIIISTDMLDEANQKFHSVSQKAK